MMVVSDSGRSSMVTPDCQQPAQYYLLLRKGKLVDNAHGAGYDQSRELKCLT
jgi:hypothetical protein